MQDVDRLYTKEEVSQILGVTESWLNTEIQAGNIRHLRLGKKKFIRFRTEHIEDYLKSKEQVIEG